MSRRLAKKLRYQINAVRKRLTSWDDKTPTDNYCAALMESVEDHTMSSGQGRRMPFRDLAWMDNGKRDGITF